MTQRTFPLEFLEFLNAEKGIARDNKTDAGASEDKEEWMFQSGKLALIEEIEKHIRGAVITRNNNKRIV